MKLRCLSVIFLFLLGMVFVSCRTSREIPKDCTNYIFENQSDYRSYFIRLDSIDGTYAEGRAYSIDDDLLMEATKKMFGEYTNALSELSSIENTKLQKIINNSLSE